MPDVSPEVLQPTPFTDFATLGNGSKSLPRQNIQEPAQPFWSASYLQSDEALSLIETHGAPNSAEQFVRQLEQDGSAAVELRDGVILRATSAQTLKDIDLKRDEVGSLAHMNGKDANLYQIQYTDQNLATAKTLVAEAGLKPLSELQSRVGDNPRWVHDENPRDWNPSQRLSNEELWGQPLDAQKAHDGSANPALRIPDKTIQLKDQEQTLEAVEKARKDGTPLRFETSTRTAEYQPGTNTVDFTDKKTGTKSELIPGQGLSGSPESAEAVRSRTEEVFGAKIDGDEFDNSDQPLEMADRVAAQHERSLESATALAGYELKTDAQVTLANKDDGIYNGKVLGATDIYLLQRSSPNSAIAHDKDVFQTLPSYGQDLTVLYSAGNARVNVQPVRDKGLGIER
jgi:hypothetical protein